MVEMLINTNGLAIFGPGSEWFWSMAQFVVVVVTLLGIYRQLRIARSANAFEQLNRIANEGESERMTRSMLDILLALRKGVLPENVPEGAGSVVADFWDRVAGLVRAGHVDRKLVYESYGNSCQWWWAALAPATRRYRIETGDPAGGAHFEWLAAVMAEMSGTAGTHQFDEASLARTLDRRTRTLQERLDAAEELRAVIVRPLSPAMPTASPPVAQDAAAPAGQPVTRGT
jgi:hypothetical protein